MKYLVLILFVVLNPPRTFKKTFTFLDVCNLVYTKHGRINDKSTYRLSDAIKRGRLMAIKQDKTGLLKQAIKDTLYMLDRRNPENGIIATMIWTKKHQVNFTFSFNSFNWTTQVLYTKFQKLLIEKWDVTTIKKEENLHGHWLDGGYVNGYRCYLRQGSLQIDEVGYSDFFNPDSKEND